MLPHWITPTAVRVGIIVTLMVVGFALMLVYGENDPRCWIGLLLALAGQALNAWWFMFQRRRVTVRHFSGAHELRGMLDVAGVRWTHWVGRGGTVARVVYADELDEVVTGRTTDGA